jgi:hypothetical protein
MTETTTRSTRPWRRVVWAALGAAGGLGSLMILDAVVPGGLPTWSGYAVAAVCFTFVYAQIIRSWLAKRAERRALAGHAEEHESDPA